jgi:hypothetical protein
MTHKPNRTSRFAPSVPIVGSCSATRPRFCCQVGRFCRSRRGVGQWREVEIMAHAECQQSGQPTFKPTVPLKRLACDEWTIARCAVGAGPGIDNAQRPRHAELSMRL